MKFERRYTNSLLMAGVIEVMLRFVTGVDFFGYFGTCMIIYSIIHKLHIWQDGRKA